MLSRRFATALGCARRVLPAVVLATALLPWTLQSPASVGADQHRPPGPEVGPVQGEPAPEPAAFLQVVLQNFYIRDDHDDFPLGSGNFRLTVGFWRCSGAPGGPCSAAPENPAVLIARWDHSFDADSDETVTLERVLPLAPDVMDGASASEELGIAVYAEQRYLLDIGLVERDADEDDLMGGIQTEMTASNGWGIATYPGVTSYKVNESLPYPGGALCAGWFCGYDFRAGDYDVTYEIRATPLPDLVPTDIRLVGEPGPGAGVCVRVENVGDQEAEVFEINLRLDGTLLPTGYSAGSNLAPGLATEPCAKVDLPTSGAHRLLATVDETQLVRERDESNNQREQAFIFRRPLDDMGIRPEVGPVDVAPEPERPDLSLSDIRVQDENPSGDNDCDPGKNQVTVVVENPDAVASFAVRLVVDNRENQAQEVLLAGMQRRTLQRVRFDDINLSPGDHTLTATVDLHNTVAESDEGNNTLTIAVSCTAE